MSPRVQAVHVVVLVLVAVASLVLAADDMEHPKLDLTGLDRGPEYSRQRDRQAGGVERVESRGERHRDEEADSGSDDEPERQPPPRVRWNAAAEIAEVFADIRKSKKLRNDPLRCNTSYQKGCMTIKAAIDYIVGENTVWAVTTKEALGCFQGGRMNLRQWRSMSRRSSTLTRLYPWDLQKCASRLCEILLVKQRRSSDACMVRCTAIAFNAIQQYNVGARGRSACLRPKKILDTMDWAWPSVHQSFISDGRKNGYMFDRQVDFEKATFLQGMVDDDLMFVKDTVEKELESVKAKSRMIESVNLEVKEKCDGFLRLLIAKKTRSSDVEDYAALAEHVKSWDELLSKYRGMIRENKKKEQALLLRKLKIREVVEEADNLNIQFEELFRAYRNEVKMAALMGTGLIGSASASSGKMGLQCEKAAKVKNSACKKHLKSRKHVWTPTNIGIDGMSMMSNSLVDSLMDTAISGGKDTLNRKQKKCRAAVQELACEVTMPPCDDDGSAKALTRKIMSLRGKCATIDKMCANEKKVLLGYRAMSIFQTPCSIAYAYSDRLLNLLETGEEIDDTRSNMSREELHQRSKDWMDRADKSIFQDLEEDGDENDIQDPSQASGDYFSDVIDTLVSDSDIDSNDDVEGGYGADVEEGSVDDLETGRAAKDVYVSSTGVTVSEAEAEAEAEAVLMKEGDDDDSPIGNIFRRLKVDTDTKGGSFLRKKMTSMERSRVKERTLHMMTKLGDLKDRAFMAEQESRIINSECPEQIRQTSADKSKELNELMMQLDEVTRSRAAVEELVRFALNRKQYMKWKMKELRRAMHGAFNINMGDLADITSDADDKNFVKGLRNRKTSLAARATQGIVCASPPFQLSFCSDVTWSIVDKSLLRDYWMSNTDTDMLAKAYYDSIVRTLEDGQKFFCPAAVKSTICHMMFPMCSLKTGQKWAFSTSNEDIDIRRPCNTLVQNVRESCDTEVVERIVDVLNLNDPKLFSNSREPCEGASWAALIATSRDPRHQKTVFKQYQVLRKAGYDDAHIVMMTPNNPGLYEEGMVSATSDSNGRQDVILWDSELVRSRIESVEHGNDERFVPSYDRARQAYVIPNQDNLAFNVKVDYSGFDISAKSIISALTGCRGDAVATCNPSISSLIDPTPHDRVLVFMSGHSNQNGMLIDQTAVHQDVLYHTWFQQMLTQIIKKKKLGKEWMFFISSCYSGRFFEGLPWDAKSVSDQTSLREMVWAITSSNTMLQSGTTSSLSKSTTTMAEGVLRYMQRVFEKDDLVASNADLDYMFEYVKLVVAMEGRGKDLTTEFPPPNELHLEPARVVKRPERQGVSDDIEIADAEDSTDSVDDDEEEPVAPPNSPRTMESSQGHVPMRTHSAREQLAYCAGFAPVAVED